tara:strand:- start:98 stop:274 length:177 start_codon:yes stop_codon:yes gene_type:complete
MKSNKEIADNFQERVNKKEKEVSTENLNYLYPNGHRMTHQMRWFKGILDRDSSDDIAA